MGSLGIYVINLKRRSDRLSSMQSRLSNLDFTVVEAIDGSDPESFVHSLESDFTAPELACIASHAKALEAFLKSEHDACVILEDDLVFGDGFFDFIKFGIDFPQTAFVIKLDTTPAQKIWISRSPKFVNGHECNVLHSIHYSAGAYVTSRKGANFILEELNKYDLTVDDVIFGRMLNNKRYGEALQLNPACCIQEVYQNENLDSDLERLRVERHNKQKVVAKEAIKRNPQKKIVRELLRIVNQVINLLKLLKRRCSNFIKNIKIKECIIKFNV